MEYKFSELFSWKSGKPIVEFSKGSIPIYGSNGIIGYTNKGNFSNKIILGRVGAYCGSVEYCPNEFYATDNTLVTTCKEDVISYLYAQYLLKLLKLNNYAGGSAQPLITQNLLKHIKCNIPKIDTQNKIASTLFTYDNLIKNNNKRIKLLEQMAENIYKEWFVRFRFPGHENTEFENGLPERWQIKRLNDFCYVTDGTHDTPKPVELGVPLVTGKCISFGFIDFNVAYNISETDHNKIKKRSGLKSGDILFSNIGTVGNCCIVDYDREFSVKNVIIFKPKLMRDTAYLYYWMTSTAMQEIFASQTNGASQQFVGLTFMRRYKILVPNYDILDAFADKILPIIEQKRLLHQKNLNLIAQRDLLLPRLMSGKLEV